MDTLIAIDHENPKCPIIQIKKTREHKNYANTPRRQSERVQILHLDDEYDSSPVDYSHVS